MEWKERLSACCELYAETCLKTFCSRFLLFHGGQMAKPPFIITKKPWVHMNEWCFLFWPPHAETTHTINARLDNTNGVEIENEVYTVSKVSARDAIEWVLQKRNTSYNTYLFLVFIERGCVGGREILDLFPIVTIENWKPLQQMDNLEWTKKCIFWKVNQDNSCVR